jgi:hypothetical protein
MKKLVGKNSKIQKFKNSKIQKFFNAFFFDKHGFLAFILVLIFTVKYANRHKRTEKGNLQIMCLVCQQVKHTTI